MTSSTLSGAHDWEVGPCVDRLSHVTSWDINIRPREGDKGVAVIASVYSGEETARAILAAIQASVEHPLDVRSEVDLTTALEVAAGRFRFLAEMQRQAGRPESKGNASILEKHADECLAAVVQAASAMSAGTAATTQIGAGRKPASAIPNGETPQ